MMEMSKHTPGPWTLVNGYNIFSELGADSGDGYKAPENDGWLVATVERGSVANDDGEIVEIGYGVTRANAHLIAAAPALLEALKNLLDISLKYEAEESDMAVEDARAAISKATGGE